MIFLKKILGILSICFLVIGCEKELTNGNTGVYISNGYEMVLKQKDNCSNEVNEYVDMNGRKVYLVCIDEIDLMIDNKVIMTLEYHFTNVNQTFDTSINEITGNLEVYDILKDGGTTIYKNDNLTVIKCNTLSGNQDIYIGNGNLKFKDSYCIR